MEKSYLKWSAAICAGVILFSGSPLCRFTTEAEGTTEDLIWAAETETDNQTEGTQTTGAEADPEGQTADAAALEAHEKAQAREQAALEARAREEIGPGNSGVPADSSEEDNHSAADDTAAADAADETTPEANTPVEREVAESEIDAYFANSVFVGDSVMVGYRNYCMRNTDPFLKSLRFLAAGSFSVHNALWPVSSKSVHPIYQGQQRPVWESISLMGADRVLMFFGLNDLNMGNDTCEKYQQVIANIHQLSPNAQITILSMTYTLRGKGKNNLNNDNIRVFNSQMQQIAAANGWDFIDLATPLSDANGDLAPQYCSDNYVHQTNAAYQVWTSVLRQFVRDKLKYTPAPGAAEAEESVKADTTESDAAESSGADTAETGAAGTDSAAAAS